MPKRNLKIGAVVLGLSMACAAHAQFIDNYEAPEFSGSAAGTVVTGQGTPDYYIPVAGSNDGLVHTYTGNALGLIDNCNGGSQFLAAQRRPSDFTRAQVGRTAADGIWGPDGTTGVLRMEYDFNCRFQDIGNQDPNNPGLQNNLASMSIQPYPANGAILLYLWEDPNNPTNFDQTYQVGVIGYFADGTQTTNAVIIFPGSALQGLEQNQWYRLAVDVDLNNNVIENLSICALTTSFAPGVPTDIDLDRNDPNAMWYLGGGSAGVGPITGYRLFGGGGAGGLTGVGNTIAIDNVSTTLNPTGAPTCNPCTGNPCGAPCPNPGCNDGGVDCDVNNDCVVGLPDLSIMLANFGGAGTCAQGDTNNNGSVQLDDLANLLARFGRNCN